MNYYVGENRKNILCKMSRNNRHNLIIPVVVDINGKTRLNPIIWCKDGTLVLECCVVVIPKGPYGVAVHKIAFVGSLTLKPQLIAQIEEFVCNHAIRRYDGKLFLEAEVSLGENGEITLLQGGELLDWNNEEEFLDLYVNDLTHNIATDITEVIRNHQLTEAKGYSHVKEMVGMLELVNNALSEKNTSQVYKDDTYELHQLWEKFLNKSLSTIQVNAINEGWKEISRSLSEEGVEITDKKYSAYKELIVSKAEEAMTV